MAASFVCVECNSFTEVNSKKKVLVFRIQIMLLPGNKLISFAHSPEQLKCSHFYCSRAEFFEKVKVKTVIKERVPVSFLQRKIK